MKDTNEMIEKIYNEMIMKKTPEERLKMCFSMLNTARRIVLSTQKNKKNWRKDLFLRFYGFEFNRSQREKILQSLDNYSIQNP